MPLSFKLSQTLFLIVGRDCSEMNFSEVLFASFPPIGVFPHMCVFSRGRAISVLSCYLRRHYKPYKPFRADFIQKSGILRCFVLPLLLLSHTHRTQTNECARASLSLSLSLPKQQARAHQQSLPHSLPTQARARQQQ